MDSNEAEELQSLVQSQGWRLFVSAVNEAWGPTGNAFQKAVSDCSDIVENTSAIAKLQQVIAAQKVVTGILQWPEGRLKKLKQPEMQLAGPMDYSRRGGL